MYAIKKIISKNYVKQFIGVLKNNYILNSKVLNDVNIIISLISKKWTDNY